MGLNAPNKKRLLKHKLSLFEYGIILIQETKLNKEKEELRRKLGFWKTELVESTGASGGIGIL